MADEEFSKRVQNVLFLAPTGALERLIFVRLSDESLSRALNLHLYPSGQPQVRLRLVSGQSQVSLRCLLGYMSVHLISGRLQEDFRKTSG